jgi:putative spermidine/putrescine transport system ATP-binding protein
VAALAICRAGFAVDHLEADAAPATPFVAEFVGTMNRIPGWMRNGRVRLLGTEADVRTAVGAVETRPSDPPVDVLVRPEGLAVTESDGGSGIVMTTTFMGSTVNWTSRH